MGQTQIFVLDFGAQYAHLICRRIRQLNVLAEIKSPEVDVSELKGVKGIILSGGPSTVGQENSPKYNPEIFCLGVPILGICYGHQAMVHELGGEVKSGKTKEYGRATLKVKESKLFNGLKKDEIVWMSHGDTVTKLPDGFEVIGITEDCDSAAIGNPGKKYFGVQFHPEVTHTPNGMKILENFVNICDCDRSWNMKDYVDNVVEDIKEKVGNKNVFLLVSGGVDSTVCFALLEKVLGADRIYGLHIDNGFVRKDESKKVKETLEEHGFRNLHVIDASNEFLKAVEGIYEPEEKRKIIGDMFLHVQEKAVENLDLNADEWILGQGTIYPDTIETGGTRNAALIKTHHNRVESVRKLLEQGKVIEPLAELYKDEVRQVGEELGLPHHLVWRHPFPGPGLAVRCLCAEQDDKVSIDGVEVLPIKSVGVQGDFRTYRHPAVLKGELDWDRLEKESTELTNKYKEINRVVYLLHDVDVSKFKVKKSYLTKKRLDVLREADDIVYNIIVENKLETEIWQFPVVLLPVGLNGESIVLRPVYSKEAMTAEFAKIDKKIVNKMVTKLLELENIDAVFYDITHKPPGTIEWE